MNNNFLHSAAEKINFTYLSINNFNGTNLTNIATNIFLSSQNSSTTLKLI